MFLIKLEDSAPVGNPITLENFKQINPSLSLPFPLMPEDIEPHGYGIYDFAPAPECGVFEKLEEVAPVKANNGIYYQTRVTVAMNEAEVTERTELEWANVRLLRNAKLFDSDKVVVRAVEDGSEVPEGWREYRQALRDITEQADPFAITWPVEPA